MPTFKYVIDGQRVPSVTTIISLLGENKRALIHAAWQLGAEGKHYKEEWGKAANAGSAAHELCECFMLNRPLPTLVNLNEEEKVGALDRFETFKVWLRQHDYKPVAAEVPIVNEKLRYGGTIDCVGLIDQKPALIDLKSKTLYKDQIIQVAAYRALWNEANPDLAIESVHVLGMTDGFHHHMLSNQNLALGWEAFQTLRQLYDHVKSIKA